MAYSGCSLQQWCNCSICQKALQSNYKSKSSERKLPVDGNYVCYTFLLLELK